MFLNQNSVTTTKNFLKATVSTGLMQEQEMQEILQAIDEKANSKNSQPEEIWRTSEACRFLKCSKPTLIYQAKKHGLNVVRLGSTLRFRKSEIMRLGGIV